MKGLRTSLPLLALVIAFGVTTVGFYAGRAPVLYNTIELPIRVYAADGTSEHIEEVTLQVSNPSGVNRLYVQAHQPFYHRGGDDQGVEEGFDPEAAAAIRINGGSWTEVRDENVTCAQPEEDFGCVAGIFSTIRFSVTASNVQQGVNTIELKFNGTEGIRSGYRVLKLGLMQASDDLQSFDPGTDGASDTEFIYEDHSEWEAPEGYGNPGDEQAGRELFQSQGILVKDAASGDPIQAACSSCHAKDGRDLKYFGYSNRSIVARSQYHGLSEEEGKQIAAYIRSIELRKKDGTPYEAPGTPWDPPYQPGPELKATGEHPDASDQVYWAAGAGLEAVLDRDEDMLPYLFPDGTGPNGVGGVDRQPDGALNWRHLSADSTLNMRALPIDAQFPDWNNWLPDIHPLDVPTSDEQPAVAQYENEVESALASGDLQDIQVALKRFRMERPGLSGKPSGWTDNEEELAAMSSYQWQAIRAWEAFHGHQLEDVADDMYCSGPDRPFCEPRSWMGRQRFLFDIAPHISSTGGGVGGPPYGYGGAAQDGMMSHLWYHLQVILNPGSGPASSAQTPVDWNYQYSFTKSTAPYRGAALRHVSSYAKMWQMQSNGYGVDGDPDGVEPDRGGIVRGWAPFTTNPWRLMGDAYWGAYGSHSGGVMDNLSDAQLEEVLTATLRVWNDYNSRFGTDEFPRDSGDNRWYNGPEDTQEFGWTSSRHHSQKIYNNLDRVASDMPGVARGVLDSISTWGAQMWPHTEDPSWDEMVNYDPSDNQAPTVHITNLSDGDEFEAPAQLVVEVDAHDADGAVQWVELLANGTEVGEDTEAPFSIAWSEVTEGGHALTVHATDDEGAAATSAPIDITVTGETVSQQHIRLQAGWNFISSRVHPGASKLDSVFAETPGLEVVQGEGGETYVPGNPDNDLREWSALESYAVFMQASDTLRLKGRRAPCETTMISLQEGWNFIPYLCEQAMPPEEAFTAIADELVRVKDGAGNEYLPAQNLNGIGKLQPGHGYKAYVSEDATLVYPALQQSE